MAFQVQQINPIDFLPSVAVGVSLPFSAKNVFNSTYTTADALKSNLINFFLTDTGERFLNPNFGAGIRSKLFEQMTQDTLDNIESTIRVGILNWFSNITILNIKIQQAQDSNMVTVLFTYSINKTNVQDQLLINFQQ